MTIGEKIQHYRKKLNISQEELGNQLSVSRQSVSLWEKDVTMPTVDNIKRLAEIFSVTVDQLMSTEEVEKEETESKEILYTLTEKNIRKVQFAFTAQYVVLLVCMTVFALFLVAALFSEETQQTESVYFVLGMLMVLYFVFISYILNVKRSFAHLMQYCNRKVYKLEFFDDHLHVKSYIDRQPDVFKLIKYDDIRQVLCIDNLYWVQLADFNFIIDKEQLPFGCQFFSLLNRPSIKVINKKTSSGLQLAGVILFVATLLSLFIGMFSMSFVLVANNVSGVDFVKYTWAMYLALPIPITSIVVGCVLKKQGRPYKKNVIAGIIFTVLLCLYGSFWFLA